MATSEKAINLFEQVVVNVAETPPPTEFLPFPFQEEAINRLEAHYGRIYNDKELGWHPGLLIMPTGSGKTATSVWWLMKDMIKKGYKVMWLSHRNQLLEQALFSMLYLSSFAKGKPDGDKLKLRIISGAHCKVTAGTFKREDIILCSIQSLIRGRDSLEHMLEGVRDE